MRRHAVIGGIVGPAVFLATAAVAGAVEPGYSPIHRRISWLAADHATTRIPMTVGMLAFGVGMLALAAGLRAGRRRTWPAAATAGAAMLGVAAFPLGIPGNAGPHAAATAALMISLLAMPILDGTRSALAAAALAVAVAIAWRVDAGLAQRAFLTVTGVWVAVHAATVLDRGTRTVSSFATN